MNAATKSARTLLLAATILAASAAAAIAEESATNADGEGEMTAMQIVERANRVAYYQGADGRARVKMTIHDPQGRKRNRELVILRWDEPDPDARDREDYDKAADDYAGEQKFYVYFERPADVNKMAFLVWKHLDSDDDRWLYRPGADLVNRIVSSQERTSFVGSDFFYEDVSGRNLSEDEHELAETTDDYYVIQSTPKDPDLVEFAYFKTWIHRESFVVVQTSYYDADDNEYRRYNVLEVNPDIQGYVTVVKSQMTDLLDKGYTVLEYEDVQYNLDIPERIFEERYLRKPPLSYIK